MRRLFLIDGLGALLSAAMLGLVLTTLEPVFGMPRSVLVPLAAVAGALAITSLTCFAMGARPRFLAGIASANTLYCAVTLGLVISLRESLTGFGIAYFLGEIAVVLTLVGAEVRSVLRSVRES